MHSKLQLNKLAQQLARSLARQAEVPREAIPYIENVYVRISGYQDWKM